MEVSNPFRPAPLGLPADVTGCRACPRLVAWREAAAGRVPPRFAAWVARNGFWARPLPAFGDPGAAMAIVGLAPAAQGGNRTGRMFTGDRSGDFLFAALHRAGLASGPVSRGPQDGLRLSGVLITAAVRCAPPQNRPSPEEAARCRPFLRRDLASLRHLRVVLALGRFAHDAVAALLRTPDSGPGIPAFRHGAEHLLAPGVWLVDSYHVSQRNTQTGLLTAAAFDAVLRRCRELAAR
jgi:uracil-DNA glycosylase family 4